MITNVKHISFKISLFIFLTFSLSACTADRHGLARPGNIHEVSCKIVIDYDDPQTGVPISEELEEKQQVCSLEPPNETLMIGACNTIARKNSNNYEIAYPNHEVAFIEPVTSQMIDGSCPLTDNPIIAGASSMLVDEYILSDSINDWTQPDSGIDPLLSKNININSTAKVMGSHVTVGAKFLAWRYAKTLAKGEINFDRSNCNYNGECDIVLRNVDLSMDDFIIERPTIFARDITVKDTRLYTQGNYKARVDQDGFFKIDNVNTIISSVIDGEEINLLNGRRISIFGHFTDALQGQNHASSALRIFIFVDNGDYIVYTDSILDVSKFPSKLANGDRQDVCLTGGPYDVTKNAEVTHCSLKVPNQAWSFEKKGQHLRIRQKMTNHCLNVKPPIPTFIIKTPFINAGSSDSGFQNVNSGFGGSQGPGISLPTQNYEGDIVNIVRCSDDSNQLWSLAPGDEVKHIKTGKCLGVEENIYRPQHDGVTVSGCSSKDNEGQRWFLNRPG